MALSPAERSLRARMATHQRWATTEDRTAATAAGRAAFFSRFELRSLPGSGNDVEEREIGTGISKPSAVFFVSPRMP